MEEDNNKYISFLLMLIDALKTKAKKIKKKSKFIDVSIFQNYLIFFMIITKNLKNYDDYIITIFDKKYNIFKCILDIITSLPKNENTHIFLNILNALFQQEYINHFFNKNNKTLEEIYLTNFTNFSKIHTGNLVKCEKQYYINIYERLLKLDFSYNNFFKNKKLEFNEDSPTYKLSIAQSIIRVVFSNEKSVIIPDIKYYEYNFLSMVVELDIKETRNKYGDKVRTLFRKEDLCDDIIKYIFFVFGNSLLINSFIQELNKYKGKTVQISLELFDIIMNNLLINISQTFPLILKVLLKLTYFYVNKYFTVPPKYYNPLYTLLFFNFIISPRVESIYDITDSTVSFIFDINKLIRNVCYNNKFKEKEPLYIFNDKIEEYNKKLADTFEKDILNIDIDSDTVKSALSELFTEKYLIYPNFLFYLDVNLISQAVEGGVENFIKFIELGVK